MSRSLRQDTLLAVGGATAVTFLVCLIALWTFAGPGRSPSRREIVIPAGTADLIADGGNPLGLPASWSFRSGDVLVLDNRDRADHFIGAWFAPYDRVTEVTLEASATVLCSLHPDGVISIDVTPRRTDWALAVPPTLMIGPAFGLVLLMAGRVLRGLDDPGNASGPLALSEAGPGLQSGGVARAKEKSGRASNSGPSKRNPS
ncbi:MAG: hypothetical protein H8E59_02635 [Actinobacteria bacterium]|nr:hypothetical protein [Actinomycetota bacterium]